MEERWRILAALTLARTAMGFQFQSVAAVSPFIGTELGLDKAQLGWLIGLYLLPGILIALPGALLGARFGDKRLTSLGLVLMAGGGAWLALAQSFAEADFARVASGTGGVILNVLITKMVMDWFDSRERMLAMSILINSWPIGIGLALLTMGPLAEAAGWRWSAALTTVFAVAGLAAVLATYRPAAGAAAPAASGLGLAVLTRTEWRLLAIASLPWMLYNAAYQIVVSFLPSFFVESGFSIARAGAVTALNTVMFMASVQAGGILLKRARHPDRLCHAAMIGWAASFLLLSTGTLPLVWIMAGGLVGGITASAFVALPAEFLRPESRGAGMGVFYTVYYFGCALFPALAGALYDRAGSARPTLWLAVGLALACVPVLTLFRRALRAAQVRKA